MRVARAKSVSRFKLWRHCKRHWCLWTRHVFFEIGEKKHDKTQTAGDGTLAVDGDGWPE